MRSSIDGFRVVVATMAMTGAVLAAADGSTVAVGPYDVVEVDTGADSVVQTGPVRLQKGGEIHKIGTGDWSIPAGAIGATGGTLGVRQGSLTLTAGGTSTYETPTAVLNRAALWLDATSANVITTNANDTAYVTVWRDVRETKSAPPYDYLRVVPRYLPSVESWAKDAPPEIRQDAHGNNVVYFGRFRSGRWMALVDKTAADDAAPLWFEGIRHAFLVFRAVDNYWFPLSVSTSAGGAQCWHPENSGSAFGNCICANNYLDDLTLPGKIHFVNGKEVDPVNTKLAKGQFLFEHKYVFKPGLFDSLANCSSTTGTETGKNRQGGDDYCEIVLFTEELTEAERVAVEDYLMSKWSIARTSGEVSIETAVGTTVNVSSEKVPVVTGDGTLVKTGAGDMVIPAAGDEVPTMVPVTVAGGRVTVRDEVPVTAVVGKVYDSERQPDGGRVSVADGVVDTIRKTGLDRLRFEALPSGLKRIDVAAGELTLAAKRAGVFSPKLASAPSVEGAMESPGFEGCGITGGTWGNNRLQNECTFAGWTFYSDEPYSNPPDYYAGIFDGNNLWGALRPCSGSAFGLVRGLSYLYTDVEIPENGFYELTFMFSQRNATMSYLDVKFGPPNALQDVARVFDRVASKWRQVKVSLPYAKAGTNRLYFHGVTGNTQSCPAVDDIRITRCARDEAVVKIPYGDFELAKSRGYTAAPVDVVTWWTPQAADAPVGWTITPSGDSEKCTLAKVGVTNEVGRLGSLPIGNRGGMWQLVLAGTDKTLSTTFAPTEFGRFRLRAEVGKYRTNNYYSHQYYNEPNIQVAVTVDGTETALGKLTPEGGRCGVIMKRAYCPTLVEIPSGAQSVTVTIHNAQTESLAMLDNFVLERCAGGEELLRNGGFETEDDWTFVDGPDVQPNHNYGDWATRLKYDLEPNYNGYAKYAGDYRLRLWNSCAAVQSVTFPEAGDYQLRFHAAMRFDSRPNYTTYQKGLVQYRAWIAADGVTNVIGKSLSTTSNYVAYCWRFHVPQAGTYDFAFEGARYANEIGKPSIDHTGYIDGASIRKIDATDEFETAPEMSEKLVVDVADGAQLRLDFAGTNKVYLARIAGRSRIGVVDAANCPGVVFGTGALYVAPKGTLITVR